MRLSLKTLKIVVTVKQVIIIIHYFTLINSVRSLTELCFKRILVAFFADYPTFITDFKFDIEWSFPAFDVATSKGDRIDISVNTVEAAELLAKRDGLFNITVKSPSTDCI